MKTGQGQIVGWSMRDHLWAELAISALLMAIQRQRPSAGLIQHSDRGVQYTCGDYQAALAKTAIIPSMSRRANPQNNAPMETWAAPGLLEALPVERMGP